MKCIYGCGQEAKYTLKNGKRICSKSHNSCPVIKNKNSNAGKNRHFKSNPNNIKIECKYCNKKLPKPNIKRHEENCYLNPKNIKYCPVCGKTIKNWRTNKTCSYFCSNSFFRQGANNGNWKNGGSNYRKIAFDFYPNKCEKCGYNKHIEILEVHHIDEDRENNNKENLMILCPNHHRAITLGYIRIDKERNFIEKWARDETGIILDF